MSQSIRFRDLASIIPGLVPWFTPLTQWESWISVPLECVLGTIVVMPKRGSADRQGVPLRAERTGP